MESHLHKFLKYSLISTAILGIIGGNLNGTVNAKHRPYRTHRIYRHHNLRRTSHSRRSHKSRNYHKVRRNKHHFKRAIHYHHKRHSNGLSKYVYYVKNKKEIRTSIESTTGEKVSNKELRNYVRKYGKHGVIKAFNIWGNFTPVSIARQSAKDVNETLSRFVRDGGNYGPVKPYYLQGELYYFSKQGLTERAHIEGLTVHQFLKSYLDKDFNGNPTDNNGNELTNTSDNSDDDSQNSTPNTSELEQQMRDATINDVNNDREANGLNDYNTSDDSLNNFAQQRAEQLPSDFSHDNSPSNGGENIAEADMGNTSMDGDPNQYNNKNGNDMANEINDSFMNYDSNQGNVHHDNILGDYNNMGVGVYSPDGQTFYVAEDFFY